MINVFMSRKHPRMQNVFPPTALNRHGLARSIGAAILLGVGLMVGAVAPAWSQSKGYPGNDLVVPPPPPPPPSVTGVPSEEQPAAPTNSLLLEYGRSSGRNEDLYSELDFGVGPNGGLVKVGYGKNEVDARGTELFTETYYLGISGFISDTMGLGLSYQSWGDSGNLRTRAFSGTVSWYREASIYSLTGIMRNIEYYTQFPLNSPAVNYESKTGTGNGIQGSYVHQFTDRFELIAEALFYEYSLNMREFGIYSDSILTNRALELGSGFLDNSYRVELGYYLPAARVSAQWENSVSAVDGTDSNTVLLRCDLFSVSGYQLYALGGRTMTSNDLTSNFGRVGVVLQW